MGFQKMGGPQRYLNHNLVIILVNRFLNWNAWWTLIWEPLACRQSLGLAYTSVAHEHYMRNLCTWCPRSSWTFESTDAHASDVFFVVTFTSLSYRPTANCPSLTAQCSGIASEVFMTACTEAIGLTCASKSSYTFCHRESDLHKLPFLFSMC